MDAITMREQNTGQILQTALGDGLNLS